MEKFATLAALAALMLFSSCKKDPEELIDPVPFLEIAGISATAVQEYDSNLVVTLLYRDEDGDLGFDHPDSLSLHILDSRLDIPDQYYVPLTSPPEHQLHVQGSLDVTLVAPFLLGNGNQETVTFTIWMYDRAGNVSNTVMTEPITISR